MTGRQELSKSSNTSADEVARLSESGPAAEQIREPSVVVAEAAHELRLPIANIKLLVETLLDGALDDREVCKRMLKRAHQEVERLQALVCDLLALEQVNKLRHELKCEQLSLRAESACAVDSISKQARDKEIKVEIEIDENQLIYANKSQLNQVLINLLENAVKFTNPGGKITLRSGQTPGSFCIEDTGTGMSESEIPKIFSKFYRIDKSNAKGGTGLGLSIVKQVLDLHGAKISVRSQEGVGSCFELEFPAADLLPGSKIK
jgi:two-component system, OmpR family, phosphate regulon sensor histidine kinase PhoR